MAESKPHPRQIRARDQFEFRRTNNKSPQRSLMGIQLPELKRVVDIANETKDNMSRNTLHTRKNSLSNDIAGQSTWRRRREQFTPG
jgi:hypothetical protein